MEYYKGWKSRVVQFGVSIQRFFESGFLGMQPQLGGKSHLKLNKCKETDSKEVQWWKGEKNSEKRFKKDLKSLRANVMQIVFIFQGLVQLLWVLTRIHIILDLSVSMQFLILPEFTVLICKRLLPKFK